MKNRQQVDLNMLLSQGLRIVLVFSLPCFWGLLMVADCFVPLFFGEAFSPAVNTLKILSILIVVFSLAYFLGHIILISAGKENTIMKITIVGALTNAILNVFLIPAHAQEGAAIASVISELVVTVLLIISGKNYYHISINKSFALSITLSNIFMVMSVLTVKNMMNGDAKQLFSSIIVGGIVYCLSLLITKNEVVLDIIKRVRK